MLTALYWSLTAPSARLLLLILYSKDHLFSLLVAHSATQYISLSVCLFVRSFVRSFVTLFQIQAIILSLLAYSNLLFSSVELSDQLTKIPWLICLVYPFYEVSIKFLVLLCSLSTTISKPFWVKSL